MALCGGSLGGALVAYAVKGILSARRDINSNPQTQSQQLPDFYGIALLAPALGIHPEALPPAPLILALRTLSHILPSQGILTPVEHPTYSSPPSSARNYSGRWPLSTSNMLLDLTARRVPEDVKRNNVAAQMEGLPSLYVIVGDRDEIVPVQSVREWYDSVTNLSNGEKTLTVLRGAGHGFFHERSSGRGGKQRTNEFADRLFEWLNDRARKDFGPR
ncbi:hypothetical protein ACHAXT_011082 [Thalassiosira profunda]